MIRGALLLALVACDDRPANAGPPCPDQPTAEVGTGTSAYEPLEDLDPLPIVKGPQGGYHLPGAVRACGVAEGTLAVDFTAVDATTGEVVTDVTTDRQTRPDGPCCVFVADLIGYLTLPDGSADPAEVLDGRVLELTIAVTDEDGAEAVGRIRVVAEAPPEE